jgi:hypothetical protein
MAATPDTSDGSSCVMKFWMTDGVHKEDERERVVVVVLTI